MALSGVDIMQDENTYKSTKQIFEEIAAVWNQMSDVSQAALAERLGGKRNMNVVMSIIQNVRDLKGAYEDSITAAGTAAEANDIYMDSITGKIGQFKAQWDVFSSTTLDSNMVKPFIGGATQLLSVLTSIINVLKGLGPVIPLVSIAAAGKGVIGLAKDLQSVDSVIGKLSKKLVDFSSNSKSTFSSFGKWIAANPMKAAGGAVAVAGVAITAYIAYMNSFAAKYKQFQDSLEESHRLAGEVDALNTSIETNKSKIASLESIKSSASGLTAVDEAELGILKQQTEELIRQRDIKEGLANVANDNASTNAFQAIQKDKGILETLWGYLTGGSTDYGFNLNPIENVQANQGYLKEKIQERDEAERELAKLSKNRNTSSWNKQQYQKYQNQLNSAEKTIAETKTNLATNIATLSTLANSMDRTTPEGKALAETAEEAYSSAMRDLNTANGKTIYDTIGEAVNSGSLTSSSSFLTGLAAAGTLSDSSVEKLRSTSSELDSFMRTTGATSKEVTEYFNDNARSMIQLGDSGMSAGLILRSMSGALQVVESNLSSLDNAYTKLQSGSFTASDLAILADTFPDIANGVDLTSGSFEGLAKNIQMARREQPDAVVDKLERMKELATSDIQVKAIDDVITSVKDLPGAIEGAASAYGKMADAIREAEAAQVELNGVLSGADSDIEYQTDVQAYKQMREFEKRGKIATGNQKYWDIAKHFVAGIDDVDADNADKYRKKIGKWENQWGEVFTAGLDDDGNWTAGGALKAMEVLSDSKKFMKQLNDLGGTLDFDSDTGELKDLHFNANTLDALAAAANLKPEALTDLVDEVSQFVDLDYNAEKPLSYFSKVADAAEAVYGDNGAFKGYSIEQSEIEKAAKKSKISTEDFTNKVKGELEGYSVEIVADVDTTQANQKIEETKKKASESVEQAGEVKPSAFESIGGAVDNAVSEISKGIDEAKKSAESTPAKVKVEADTTEAEHKIEYVKHKGAEKNTDRHQGPKNEQAQVKKTSVGKNGYSGSTGKISSKKTTKKDNSSSVKVKADTSQAESQINSLISKITGQTYTMKVKTDASDQAQSKPSFSTGAAVKAASGLGSQISGALKDRVVNITAKVTGTNEVTDLKKAEDTVKDKKVTVAANSKGKSGVDALRGSINSTKGKKVNVNANTSGKGSVDSLRGSINSLHDKNVTITTTVRRVTMNIAKNVVSKATGAVGKIAGSLAHHINGTAHILGTAFKSGTWGAKNSGRAIGGEVGPELVIRGNRFFTIGDDGAEFFNYRKGDVIFNAAQTEEIFRKGKLTGSDTRAHDAFLQGNAFVSGSGVIGGLSTGGTTKPSTSSSKKKKKTSNSSGKKTSSSSKRKTTKSSNKSKNTKKKTKKAKKKKKSSSNKEVEYFDWVEVVLDRIERKIKRLDTTANSTFKKMGTRNKALKKEMSAVSKEITLQQKGYNRYIKAANKVGLSSKYKKLVQSGAIDIDGIKDEKLQKKISQYQEWYNKAMDCKDAIQELKEKESELTKQRFDNIVKSYEQTFTRINTFSDTIQSFIDLAETRGFQNNTRYYRAMMGFDKKEITKLKAERKKLTNELNRDVKSGKIKLHSEAWYEMRAQIDDTTKAIVDATKDWEESANKIRQIEWDRADYNHQSMTNFADEATFLAGLVDDSEIYNDNGDFTKRGLMVQGLHTQNYNTYMRDADAYAKDLRTIDKKIAKDPYDKELLDRRQELLEAQRKSIEAAQQEKKSLQDLAKNGVQKVVTSLKDLIDKYLKALDSQKDLYDYQKKMKEKTSNISSLQKQLNAYAGDTSEEGRLKYQKLQKELKDAQEDLRDTQYDKYISDTKELLNDFYSDYEESMNKKVEDLKGVLQDSIEATNANASKIYSAIKSVAGEVGYTISTAMKNSWNASTGNTGSVVESYGKGYYKDMTSTNTALRKVQDDANNLYWNNKQDAKAAKNIAYVEDQAEVPVTTTTKPPKKTSGSSSNKSSKVSSALAKKYSFFIPKKYSGKYTKSQLKKLKKSGKGGIKSRLGLYDVDYSTKALKKYYVKMGLGKKYTGTSKQNQAMIKWLSKRGFASGVEDLPFDQFAWTQERAPEAIIRRSDNALLTPLKRGDSVLNKAATANIWDMANNPAEFIMNQMKLPFSPVQANGGTINNTIDLEITLPSVNNYEEFMNAARSDPKFEKLIQAMTVDRMARRSAQAKNSIKW